MDTLKGMVSAVNWFWLIIGLVLGRFLLIKVV